MIEHIDKEKAKKYSSGSKGSSKFGKIPEEPDRTRGSSEPVRPSFFLSPSESKIAATSPGEITPADEYKFTPEPRSNTDPTKWKPAPDGNHRAQTLDPKKVQPNYFPPVPIPAQSAEHEADRQQALGGSARLAEKQDGVLRKDTVLTPGERNERQEQAAPEMHEAGRPFKLQWLKVGRVPFNQTRQLRNPWNADREVKVSRDGTEVEPSEQDGGNRADDRCGIAVDGAMGQCGFCAIDFVYTRMNYFVFHAHVHCHPNCRGH